MLLLLLLLHHAPADRFPTDQCSSSRLFCCCCFCCCGRMRCLLQLLLLLLLLALPACPALVARPLVASGLEVSIGEATLLPAAQSPFEKQPGGEITIRLCNWLRTHLSSRRNENFLQISFQATQQTSTNLRKNNTAASPQCTAVRKME
jgi:hypothetical protein